MNIEKDVVLDLVPLYLSGEASPASRRMVEEWAKNDPQVAKLIHQGSVDVSTPELPPASVEMKSLTRTKSMLRLRGNLAGLAIFLTLIPFSFGDVGDGFFWLWQSAPNIALGAAALAAVAWAAFGIVAYRLRIAGW